MKNHHVKNPYRFTELAPQPEPDEGRNSLLSAIGIGISCFYVTSALTLPFANRLWFGEVPVLAVFQLPKAFFKSFIHELLIHLLAQIEWTRGSPSLDYFVLHAWAMAFMVSTLPVLIFGCMLVSSKRRLAGKIVILAGLLDGIVTIWFDQTSPLKLFNAVYF